MRCYMFMSSDAPYPPPNHPEEAAVSPTLTQAQVLEDPDPAEGTAITELPSSDAENGVPNSSDPAVTEDLYSTKLAPAVIATTAIHLPEACREPVVVGPCKGAFPRFYYNATTHSCQTFLFGGCRDKANNFLSREECESTCRGGAAPPEEELTPESLPPVPATTVRLPPDPTEETTTTEQPPPTKTTTASPASDWPFWSWVDIPDQYWIFIYAGAGAVGLLILILTIVLVIVCRRRRRREAYRVRMHPGKRWRDSEQGGFYDRMRKGTRFGRQEPVYANVRTGPKHKHKPKQKRRR
ncbi:hypothetical protein ACEWY4_018546 [Coilia grayii]|uniref:BPTI/Kunitz inhibitor domain-containing protein n=1 Tax=Coilia grayii TaxID=363190 RepID=A0ABD1JDJ4_9TELE